MHFQCPIVCLKSPQALQTSLDNFENRPLVWRKPSDSRGLPSPPLESESVSDKGSTMFKFLFFVTWVAGEFLSCSAQMESCLVGEGGPYSKSSFCFPADRTWGTWCTFATPRWPTAGGGSLELICLINKTTWDRLTDSTVNAVQSALGPVVYFCDEGKRFYSSKTLYTSRSADAI